MEKSAGVVLYRMREGKRQYLLLLYSYKTNYWGLAKGNIETGETEEQAALREVREETSLEKVRLLPAFKEKTSYFYVRDDGIKVFKEVVWFAGEVFDTQEGRISSEHEELRWVSYEEAMKMMQYEKDKEVVRKAELFLNR